MPSVLPPNTLQELSDRLPDIGLENAELHNDDDGNVIIVTNLRIQDYPADAHPRDTFLLPWPAEDN